MASGAVPSSFSGSTCPLEIQFGFVHGPNPATCHVKLAGKVLPPPGIVGTFNIGPSVFVGFVTNREYDPIADETTVRLVDWRDRLHDTYLRAAFNVQDSDGRFYHILPNDWSKQRRTYVTKDLGQFDFTNFQALPPNTAFNIQVAKNRLYSAYTLLRWIAQTKQFVITADPLALSSLKQHYPLNLDWNNGSTTVANAIQQIVSKCGMQFTCFGQKNMHVTIRGYPNNTFSNAIANNFLNICNLGVSSGKIGDEMNELGKRVQLIGDKNKYEYVFMCRANWNPAWTWGMVFGGIELQALLKAHDLTMFSKVKDLPEKYHDDETYAEQDQAGEGELPERKTRNTLTIREYIDKIAFKCYIVDAEQVVTGLKNLVEDDFTGQYFFMDRETCTWDTNSPKEIKDFATTAYWNSSLNNFLYPLSRSLITDSNLQFLVYASSRNIVRGKDHPFGVQYSMVPQGNGISLDVEEVVNPGSGRSEYRVRIFFNGPQFWLPKDKEFDDPRSVEPDRVAIRLCLDRELYGFWKGATQNVLRVREQAVTVRGLYKAFINNVEQTVLRENYRRDLKKGGQTLQAQPVLADDVAKRIAIQLLMHQLITKSGNLSYDDMCGAVPDGIIDSVNVSYNAERGISETVNFTSGTLDDKEINSPVPVRLSRPFKTEEEIARDRLLAIAREAAKDKKVMGKSATFHDVLLHEPGALLGVPFAAKAYGKDGIVSIVYEKAHIESITESEALKGGSVIALDAPEEETT